MKWERGFNDWCRNIGTEYNVVACILKKHKIVFLKQSLIKQAMLQIDVCTNMHICLVSFLFALAENKYSFQV